MHRVIFLTVPPRFQYHKENVVQPAIAFLIYIENVIWFTFSVLNIRRTYETLNVLTDLRCEVLDCNHNGGLKAGGIINICGVIAPFIIISVSYLSISLFVRRETKQINTGLGVAESQVDSQQLPVDKTKNAFTHPG